MPKTEEWKAKIAIDCEFEEPEEIPEGDFPEIAPEKEPEEEPGEEPEEAPEEVPEVSPIIGSERDKAEKERLIEFSWTYHLPSFPSSEMLQEEKRNDLKIRR